MAFQQRDEFYRGRDTHTLVPAQTGVDTPVFDRAAFTPARTSYPSAAFSRTDADRRPGKPLPPEATGDPHPDRLAIAERTRQAIIAQEARYRIEGSVDREDLRTRGPGRKSRSQQPDVETPRGYYVDVAPEDAALEARRGDQVFYFMSCSDAARCMTGERTPKWAVAVKNAAGGVSKHAFGWTWTRLKSRRGRNR